MRDALASHHYDASWFVTGADAIAAIEKDMPDLVLLDTALPDVDGFSLCRWLRTRDAEVSIILVSARDAEIDIVVGLDAGAND